VCVKKAQYIRAVVDLLGLSRIKNELRKFSKKETLLGQLGSS